MAGAAAQPMTFDAANEWLRSRVNVATDMTSAELALAPDFDARVRAHCFFSARVQYANALEAIRERLEVYAAGDMDLATARWKIKSALVDQGYAADDVGMADTPPAGMDEEEWTRRKAITNLGSTRRIDLILNQNARMGWAVGRKQVSEHPAVMERWPNYEYLARDDARPAHAALDGIVLPKTDPFWHTHTPPWDFNCRCDIEDSDAPAAGTAITAENADGSQTARVVNPNTAAQGTEILPNESGFVFRSDEPFAVMNISRIRSMSMRGALMGRLRQLARTTGARFNVTLQSALEAPAVTGAMPPDASDLIEEAARAVRAGESVPDTEIEIGRLSADLVAQMGLDPEESVVKLGGGKAGLSTSPYGFQHQIHGSRGYNHRDALLNGEMREVLDETLFAAGKTQATVGFNGGKMYLNIINPDTDALTTIYRHGSEWQVASAARRGEAYVRSQAGLVKKRRGRE